MNGKRRDKSLFTSPPWETKFQSEEKKKKISFKMFCQLVISQLLLILQHTPDFDTFIPHRSQNASDTELALEYVQ